MTRTVIVGTVGIAGICRVPALRAQAHRAVIVAAVDVDAARAEAFAAEHGISSVYTDLHTMFEEQRPDLVHLSTPPFLHADQAVACLEPEAWAWCRSRHDRPSAGTAEGRRLSHLGHGEVSRLERPEHQLFGMRGRLHTYPVPDPPTRPLCGSLGSPHPHPPKELF
ncbi:Gfo/Idh/MocA family oxidoreductase [Streptomyces sp. NPDC052236]|uniref:Gfo/Idh/MocA family oxidoreductase n=1 Tax=Streptomyces sp. NPDC052236 TaxID=3365686 RepID=UPI0037D11827